MACQQNGYFVSRNCRKYFADRPWNREREAWWSPVYRVRDGVAIVSTVKVNECPRSVIEPESERLVQLFSGARHVHEASGASLYGPNQSKWPARAWDAQRLLERCRIEQHNAETEALSKPNG